MLAVFFYLGCVGLLLTLSLLGPIFVGLLAGETEVSQRLGFYLLLGGFLFGGPILAIAGRLRRVPQIGRLMLLFLVWTVLPLAAAIPIEDISDLGFVDSLFEAVSGLTTTGSSVLNTVEIWPQALIFWRVQLQWIGGYLALLTVIMVIAPMGIGGLTPQTSAVTSGAELRGGQRRLLIFAVNLGLLYATMTALCFLAFFLSGTRPFYAVTLAMTATSTGGFLPFDGSLDQVLGLFSLFVFGLFLVFGATCIFWQRMLLSGNFSGLSVHRESYSVLTIVGLLTLAFTILVASVSSVGDLSPGRTLVEAFLNSASLVATSGVETRPGYFTLMPLVLVLFVVLVGGSAFSTSGGLKHYRLGGMIVQSWSELDRLIYPNVVRSSHFGSEKYDMQLMKAIWSFFVVAVLTIGIGTIFVATAGIPFEAALTATIATFSTAGPLYDAGWATDNGAPWPPYSAFPVPAKCALMLIMLLGRLEVLAILGLFSARYWRSR